MGSFESKAEHCFETGNEQLNRTRSPSFDSRLYEDDRNLEPWYQNQGTEQYRPYMPLIVTDSYVREVSYNARNLGLFFKERSVKQIAFDERNWEPSYKKQGTEQYRTHVPSIFTDSYAREVRYDMYDDDETNLELVWKERSGKRIVLGDRNSELSYIKQGTEQYRTHVPSISTDSYVREVRNVARNLSTVDRKLYNFAKLKIAEEDLDKAEITIGFQHQDSIVIKGVNNPTEKVYIGLDFDGRPKLVRKGQSVKRKVWGAVKKFFVWCFNTLKNVLLYALDKALAIGPVLTLPALK